MAMFSIRGSAQHAANPCQARAQSGFHCPAVSANNKEVACMSAFMLCKLVLKDYVDDNHPSVDEQSFMLTSCLGFLLKVCSQHCFFLDSGWSSGDCDRDQLSLPCLCSAGYPHLQRHINFWDAASILHVSCLKYPTAYYHTC